MSHGQYLRTLIIVTKVTILYAIPDGSTCADVKWMWQPYSYNQSSIL